MTRPSDLPWSTMGRGFQAKSSTASASLTCPPARAPSAAEGWVWDCSSPRPLSSAPAPLSTSGTPPNLERARWFKSNGRAPCSSTPNPRKPACSTLHDHGDGGVGQSRTTTILGKTRQLDAGPMTGEEGNGAMVKGEDTSLLIVDDDRPFLTRLARAMEARGFKVDTAESVEEAVGKARAHPPAYAVIDMRLADGNGLDVVAAIRDKREDARTIILTGYGNIATAVTAVKLGAVDYLSKPADADDIFAALTRSADERAAPPENPMSADRVRWEHIQRVYEMCDRNVSETARRLNMHRRTLQRILAKRAPRRQVRAPCNKG